MATTTQTILQQQDALKVPHLLLSKAQSDSDISSTNSESLLPDIPLPPPSKALTEVLSVDKDTPDYHVPRDPRLIRLTGVHPFNVEPPLTTLFNEGIRNIDSL